MGFKIHHGYLILEFFVVIAILLILLKFYRDDQKLYLIKQNEK